MNREELIDRVLAMSYGTGPVTSGEADKDRDSLRQYLDFVQQRQEVAGLDLMALIPILISILPLFFGTDSKVMEFLRGVLELLPLILPSF